MHCPQVPANDLAEVEGELKVQVFNASDKKDYSHCLVSFGWPGAFCVRMGDHGIDLRPVLLARPGVLVVPHVL